MFLSLAAGRDGFEVKLVNCCSKQRLHGKQNEQLGGHVKLMYQTLSSTIRRTERMLVKVPEMTIYFWIVKLLTTGMGEVTSDYLVYHMNQFLAVTLGALGLAVALWIQFSVRRYVAWIYWLVAVMVSIFGTMAADATHIVLGVPYWASTLTFTIVLAIVFMLWYRSEKTLSIHSIYTARREVFYWLTVLVTFALGTATGDMTAMTLHLGYLNSGILFTILMLLPAIGFWLFRLNGIFAFWFAYIMTRPVGASYADWMSVPKSLGGLAYGKAPVAVVLTIIIALLVGFLTITRRDIKNRAIY